MRVDDHSLMDPDIQENPYEYYRALREQAPVYRMPDTGYYVVSCYRDIQEVIAHPEIYSIDLVANAGATFFQHEVALEILRSEGWMRDTRLSTDPPRHRDYRSLVDVSFTAGRVKKSEPFIRQIVERLLGSWGPRGQCDFMRDFCVPLPMAVITDRLGLPPEDTARLKMWSEAWIEPLSYALSQEREIEVAHLNAELQQYLVAKMDEKRQDPQEDILSDLATGILGGEAPLSTHEALGMAEHILVGGNETTTNAIASGMMLLIQNPGALEELHADRSLVRNFVEEVLRLESPTQGLFRVSMIDTDLRGVKIPQGSMVHLRFAAANRDPEKFPEPDRLNLQRKNSGAHMAFSQGEHHCLGAPLARQEMRLAFEGLLERGWRFDFAAGGEALRHLPGLSLRGLAGLEIQYATRAS